MITRKRSPDLEASLMHGHGSTPNTPRWVKVFGIRVIALLMLAAGLHLVGRALFGGHASGTTEHRTQQP
jgi:hypothetical protein